MITSEIAAALGIPLVRVSRIICSPSYPVGYHPTDNAALRRPGEFDILIAARPWLTVVADVLHELCHVIAGPDSLDDEGPLMAVQWALMQRLPTDEYAACRLSWRDYALNEDNIGSTDSFLAARHWEGLVQQATEEGLLGVEGEPNIRAHPAW